MRKYLAIVLGIGAALALAIPAHASSASALTIDTGDTGSVSAQYHVVDSPLDHNSARIKLAVAEQTGNDWAAVVPSGTRIIGAKAVDVHRIGFDVRTTGYLGAGAPRISVGLDSDGNGSTDLYAYLSAGYCAKQIGSSDWASASFAQPGVGCALYANDGGPYVSTATSSAWAVFAAAHPTATVKSVAVVQDEVGQAFVDRIRVGAVMFDRGTIS